MCLGTLLIKLFLLIKDPPNVVNIYPNDASTIPKLEWFTRKTHSLKSKQKKNNRFFSSKVEKNFKFLMSFFTQFLWRSKQKTLKNFWTLFCFMMDQNHRRILFADNSESWKNGCLLTKKNEEREVFFCFNWFFLLHCSLFYLLVFNDNNTFFLQFYLRSTTRFSSLLFLAILLFHSTKRSVLTFPFVLSNWHLRSRNVN